MKPLDTAAALALIVSGAMLIAWGLFSLLGTLMGAGVTLMGAVTMDEELLIGVPIFLIYGLWVLVSLSVGPIQLFAGVQLFRGRPKTRLTWVAALGGLAGTVTFYCAMPSLVAFALGLAALLTEDIEESAG